MCFALQQFIQVCAYYQCAFNLYCIYIYSSDRLNVVRNYNAPADTFSTGDDQTRPPFVVEFEYMEGTNSAASRALPI